LERVEVEVEVEFEDLSHGKWRDYRGAARCHRTGFINREATKT
jgi:hypothetical protein